MKKVKEFDVYIYSNYRFYSFFGILPVKQNSSNYTRKLHQNWRHSVVFIASFEQISNLALIFLSLKLKQVNARWVKG